MSEPPQPRVDAARWEALARAALSAEGAPPDSEVNVLFVGESEMAALNRDHMGADRPTDVLSFPLDFADGIEGWTDDGAPAMAGDIVICPAVAARNAPAHAGILDDELALLVIHGVLHLLGHDHADPQGEAAMQSRERALLDGLHGPLARDPWAVAS